MRHLVPSILLAIYCRRSFRCFYLKRAKIYRKGAPKNDQQRELPLWNCILGSQLEARSFKLSGKAGEDKADNAWLHIKVVLGAEELKEYRDIHRLPVRTTSHSREYELLGIVRYINLAMLDVRELDILQPPDLFGATKKRNIGVANGPFPIMHRDLEEEAGYGHSRSVLIVY